MNYSHQIFKKITNVLKGKGLRHIPFASSLYQFFYKKFRPKGIVRTMAEGHTIFVDSRDTALAPYLIMHGAFDLPQTKVLKELLKPGMIFVDIGANIGYFSLIAAKCVGPQGHVYAFEPDGANFDLLQKNIKENGYHNITAIKKAVSDTVGQTTFYLEEDNLCAHSIVPKEGKTKVQIETTTLNDFFKDKKTPDVVKIDVEGAEPLVLSGMKDLLDREDSPAIITEFYPNALKRCGYNPRSYLGEFIEKGFTLFHIDEMGNKRIITKERVQEFSEKGNFKKLANILCIKE